MPSIFTATACDIPATLLIICSPYFTIFDMPHAAIFAFIDQPVRVAVIAGSLHGPARENLIAISRLLITLFYLLQITIVADRADAGRGLHYLAFKDFSNSTALNQFILIGLSRLASMAFISPD